MYDKFPIDELPNPFEQRRQHTRIPQTITVQPTPIQQQDTRPPQGRDITEIVIKELATLFAEFSDYMISFWNELAAEISLDNLPEKRTKKPGKPMGNVQYAVPEKFGTMVFSRIEQAQVFGLVAIGYKNNEFVFQVPIKMYKIVETILTSMGKQIDWRKL